jgi:hypothetical protein
MEGNPSMDCKQLIIEKTQLAALWQGATPNQNQIQAKQQEINALRDQFQAERIAFWLQAQKICPQADMGMERGPGRGMGMAMGPGGRW